ncbi:MAG: hypothetical protein IJC88_05390 [Oscillospiraceae bacterium]|nr:hypothetical protein [Oscillospiraceae bacterium]
MKKRFISLVCICLVFTTVFMAAASGIDWLPDEENHVPWIEKGRHNSIFIFGAGGECEFENEILYIDGKTYAPLRELMEFMRIPVEWWEINGLAVINPCMKEIYLDGEPPVVDGIIPDEETALKFGKMILEQQTGTKMEYQTLHARFYLRVSYMEGINAWDVWQDAEWFGESPGNGHGPFKPCVRINKATGEVIYLCTNCEFWTNPPLK